MIKNFKNIYNEMIEEAMEFCGDIENFKAQEREELIIRILKTTTARLFCHEVCKRILEEAKGEINANNI